MEEHTLFHAVRDNSLFAFTMAGAASEAARALCDQLPAANFFSLFFLSLFVCFIFLVLGWGFFVVFFGCLFVCFSPQEKLALWLLQPAPALKGLTIFLVCQINTPIDKRSSTKPGKLAPGRKKCLQERKCLSHKTRTRTRTKLH